MVIIDTLTHFYDPSRPPGVPWPSPDNELLYRTVLPEHNRALAAPEGVTDTTPHREGSARSPSCASSGPS